MNQTPPRFVTLGVYGFDEQHFFHALISRGVDTFCDLRQRRGMRGGEYAFVNSQHLQVRLAALNIYYAHFKQLAPSQAIRSIQKRADKKDGEIKRTRQELSQEFVTAYERERLADFNANTFLSTINRETHVIALFCVERDPIACHRSIVARRLEADFEVEHVLP